MLLFDVNVVLAAHRADHPHHTPAMRALRGAIDDEVAFTVPLTVWVSLLRLATDRRVFPVPSAADDVLDFADAVEAQPTCISYAPGPNHLRLLRRVCGESAATGALVPDASLAAQALELGAEVVTFDRDFGRFSSVRSRILTP